MALIDRLSGIGIDPDGAGPGTIASATFAALLMELVNGEVTKAQIVSYLVLDASEETELDWLIGKYNAQPTAEGKKAFLDFMRPLFNLAEAKVPGYTTNADITARINRL